ncbi:hypothetical protein MMC22_004105 [Lobaria immixta]|nr:hypothetical protein [Lobaria immixta]
MSSQTGSAAQIGGLPPPPGVTPNFVNPENHTVQGHVVFIMCLVLSTLFVVLRTYTRFILLKSHGWEDYACLIGWLGLVGILVTDFVSFKHGAGRHQWDVPYQDIKIWAQSSNVKAILNSPSIFFVKVSIVLQFKRIFVPLKKGTAYYSVQAIIWLNGIYYTVTFFAGIFTCVPRHKLWEPATPGHCLNSINWYVASGLVNVVSDFAILLIPIFCISLLQMPLKRKIGISVVFAIGLFACSTSIMRAVVSFRLFGVTDLTWELIPLAYWSDAEIASGLVCVAVPVLPQLIRRLAPVIKSTFSSYHRGSKGNGSKTFKGSWGGAKYDKHTADGPLGEWDPYGDLLTPKGDYLKMEGNSSGTKSEETVATKQASPEFSVARDGFTEGGVLVRDLESGLHP